VRIPSIPKVRLGKSDVLVSPIGVGTNAWGLRGKPRPELKKVFQAALEREITLFDTAELYGFGGSERTLAEVLSHGSTSDSISANGQEGPVVLTKFLPLPWRLRKPALLRALRSSLRRLNLPLADIYLIHFPLGPVPIETWVEGLADAYEAGLVRALGVSNFNASQLQRAHKVLASRGVPLSCNEVEFSLLHRGIERNGTLAACRELGVTLIAYRPLGLGSLTGSASLSNGKRHEALAHGVRNSATKGLAQLVREIGETHGGRTPPQVALNWILCKGALPIFGTTKVAHVEENFGALGWRLNDQEMAALDAASSEALRKKR
jgi:aryl-alcohol dehydrogenase-like predicted oxidoreductase